MRPALPLLSLALMLSACAPRSPAEPPPPIELIQVTLPPDVGPVLAVRRSGEGLVALAWRSTTPQGPGELGHLSIKGGRARLEWSVPPERPLSDDRYRRWRYVGGHWFGTLGSWRDRVGPDGHAPLELPAELPPGSSVGEVEYLADRVVASTRSATGPWALVELWPQPHVMRPLETDRASVFTLGDTLCWRDGDAWCLVDRQPTRAGLTPGYEAVPAGDGLLAFDNAASDLVYLRGWPLQAVARQSVSGVVNVDLFSDGAEGAIIRLDVADGGRVTHTVVLRSDGTPEGTTEAMNFPGVAWDAPYLLADGRMAWLREPDFDAAAPAPALFLEGQGGLGPAPRGAEHVNRWAKRAWDRTLVWQGDVPAVIDATGEISQLVGGRWQPTAALPVGGGQVWVQGIAQGGFAVFSSPAPGLWLSAP